VVDQVRAWVPVSSIAAGFHQAVVAAISEVVNTTREHTGIDFVGLTGGVFQNALLLSATRRCLEEQQFRVFTHCLVPCNDGGLALGQAAVVAAQTSRRIAQPDPDRIWH
jgi:hydrogenase maturation protein HypF